MATNILRHLAYRVGRKLYAWARGDPPNDPRRNGEYWLVEQAVPLLPAGSIVLDIGANEGDWTRQVLSALREKALQIFAFEPCAATRTRLEQNLRGDARTTIMDLAVSDHCGEALFYSAGTSAGTNSLNAVSGSNTEKVKTTTIDQFMSERGISHLALVKVDVEGFDALVLKGARTALEQGRIDLIQFEYNWRWLLNGLSLHAVFAMLQTLPYRLGKLAGNRIVLYDQWHFELDRFFENNYVLVRKNGPFEALGSPATIDRFNVQCW